MGLGCGMQSEFATRPREVLLAAQKVQIFWTLSLFQCLLGANSLATSFGKVCFLFFLGVSAAMLRDWVQRLLLV